ncbi:relaxase [Kitasatospora sp. GP82]|uniref:relaxase n=1 Tax=Kitasatospora sp. GP82 TaxID=3035089 RepID=UPI0024738886|nr:relaxase [Kitasatospora sp. GP82]
MHAAQGHHRQAGHARDAAAHLRTAYARHAGKPIAHLDTRGRSLPQPVRDRQAQAVRQALPADQSTRVLGSGSWGALAVTLAEVEAVGHDPAVLLAQAAGRRELATAASPAAVLTWRIRRDAGLPAPVPTATPEERRTAAALSRTAGASRAATEAITRLTTPPPTPPIPRTTRPSR